MLRVIVLGAAAGGGLPQWNCGCANCAAARRAEIASATQTSLAISADGANWYLVNAAPDLRQQVSMIPRMHLKGTRRSPLAGVILTNAEVDAVAGLLCMREGTPFTLYATRQVLDVLRANTMFDVLREGVVTRTPIAADKTIALQGFDVTPFAVSGKEALYLEGAATDDGATLGLTIRNQDGKLAHLVTACAEVTDKLKTQLDGADAIFFDGTLWRDDELIAQGLGQKTGARMGHVAMHGEQGAIARLADVQAKRKIFVHINNTNPVWQPNSPERKAAERAGWEIGFDGMEIVL